MTDFAKLNLFLNVMYSGFFSENPFLVQIMVVIVSRQNNDTAMNTACSSDRNLIMKKTTVARNIAIHIILKIFFKIKKNVAMSQS